MGKAMRDTQALAEGQRLRIEHRAVGELVPYARNARTHSEAQVALIAGSIREYGFTNPVLVDGENGIIAGHGRVMAARTLGLATVSLRNGRTGKGINQN
jgi:ParB-like chromosome segregation protein Spo0J